MSGFTVTKKATRPVGSPDKCFYCGQKVGQEHAPECVTIQQRRRVRVVVEFEMDAPLEGGEFHLEENWCFMNLPQAIAEFTDRAPENTCTMCGPENSLEVIGSVGEPFLKE